MTTSTKTATQTAKILIRCSPEQKEKIFLNASMCKKNVTQYLLAVALNENIKTPEEHKEIEVLLQLKADLARLGNLFKMYLDNGNTDTDLFNKTFNEINDLKSKIGKTLERVLK
jgi:uncharacterized protein (DUF1778 family)